MDQQQEVRRSRFEAVWESATDAMSLSDSEGTVLAANPAYYKLYGLEPHAVVGRPFVAIFPENGREPALDDYQRYFALHVDGTVENVPVVHADGSELRVDVRFNFVQGNGTVMMLSVIRDMTAGAQLLEDERALSIQKDTMLATVAHDLRTPLTSVRGHAQLLLRWLNQERSATRSELINGLQEIERTTIRMAGLTGEMLDAGRMQLGKPLDLQLSDVDLEAVAQSVLHDYSVMYPDRAIVVEATEHLVGQWDGARLERVVDNLLSNAVKYSKGNSLRHEVAQDE